MSTVPPPVQNTSIIRKVRGYFNLACEVAGKVFDLIDGPLTSLEQRAKTNFGEIRNRVHSYVPQAVPQTVPRQTLVGGKRRSKKLRTQKKQRR